MSEPASIWQRLARARGWVAAQFWLTPVLILVGLAWTRLPDQHGWQVALTLLLPLLLTICLLEFEAATMRKLADDEGRRVKLVVGAAAMLVWIAIAAAGWVFLDWCDLRIPLWAGYLNSKASTGMRATTFTNVHLVRWLTMLEWLLRWIVLPAKLVPFAATSAQWGLRVQGRRVIRLLWNWRWWVGVVLAALAGVWLPGHFFAKAPSGTVTAQEWHVALKLVGAYLLAVSSWVLLLAWWAALFAAKRQPPSEEALVGAPVLAGPPQRSRLAKVEPQFPDADLED